VADALPDPLPNGTSIGREALQLCESNMNEARSQSSEKQGIVGKGRSMSGSNACLLQVVKDREKRSSDEMHAATIPASTRNLRPSGRPIQAIDQIAIPIVGSVSGRKGAVPGCRPVQQN